MKPSILLHLILLACFGRICFGQTEAEFHSLVDKPAVPYGGLEFMYNYIMHEFTPPEDSEPLSALSRPIVMIKITETGGFHSAEVIRSVHKSYEQSLIQLLKETFPWQPAILKNQPVSSTLVLPFYFSPGLVPGQNLSNWVISSEGKKFWHPFNKTFDTFIWTGNTDTKGNLTGTGKLTLYVHNTEQGWYEGNMRNGFLHGLGSLYLSDSLLQGWFNNSIFDRKEYYEKSISLLEKATTIIAHAPPNTPEHNDWVRILKVKNLGPYPAPIKFTLNYSMKFAVGEDTINASVSDWWWEELAPNEEGYIPFTFSHIGTSEILSSNSSTLIYPNFNFYSDTKRKERLDSVYALLKSSDLKLSYFEEESSLDLSYSKMDTTLVNTQREWKKDIFVMFFEAFENWEQVFLRMK